MWCHGRFNTCWSTCENCMLLIFFFGVYWTTGCALITASPRARFLEQELHDQFHYMQVIWHSFTFYILIHYGGIYIYWVLIWWGKQGASRNKYQLCLFFKNKSTRRAADYILKKKKQRLNWAPPQPKRKKRTKQENCWLLLFSKNRK